MLHFVLLLYQADVKPNCLTLHMVNVNTLSSLQQNCASDLLATYWHFTN